jgi:hypothetical protein
MTRERLKEFRKVRRGAVMLHWTPTDAAEYQAWVTRRPMSDSTALVTFCALALFIAVPIIHHHNLIHHAAHGAVLRH